MTPDETYEGLPLAGLTVVSLEQAVAAPFASRQLADLGARVIKIERSSGDFARGYDTKVHGMASYFAWLNRGKESLVLDLKSSRGRRALRALVKRADVVMQNLAPGAVERLGMGAGDALALNPRLIHVSISGYGTGGSFSEKKAYDLLVQCEAGLLSVTGTPDQPVKVGISVADIAAGMYAYSGVLTALLQRGRTGRGQVLEVSMLEALGEWMSQPYLYAEYGGAQQPRSGAEHATIAPYGPFEVRDGVVFLGVQNEREWSEFCGRVLLAPEIGADQRFVDNESRVQHRLELHEVIAHVLSDLDADEALTRLDAAGIANARLRSMRQFSDHPQLRERDRWRQVDSPVGSIRALIPPATFAAFEAAMGPVPYLGQHTESIMNELGLA